MVVARGAPDVVVVGGGVIGLCCAWRLAARGRSVTLCDPAPTAGASWVAAGMLAPVTEVQHGEEELLRLTLAAARRWPSFADELESASGGPVGWRPTGTLLVAVDADDRRWAQALHRFQRSLGLAVEWLTPRQARQLEPALAPALSGAIWAPEDHQVDNRQLLAALRRAVEQARVEVRADAVVSLQATGGAVSGVTTADGTAIGASHVVLCAGWQSGAIEGLPAGLAPPVRPVKGQILRLVPADGSSVVLERTVRAFVASSHVYLVPRATGEVVVGATMEEMGPDTTPTAGGVHELLRDALAVVPALRELVVAEVAAGLRPGSPDNAPLIGPAPGGFGVDGLVIATGHYRNGLLLAPLTADAVVAAVEGEPPVPEVLPFAAERFAAERSRGDSGSAGAVRTPGGPGAAGSEGGPGAAGSGPGGPTLAGASSRGARGSAPGASRTEPRPST